MNGNHRSKLKKRAAALAVASCLSLLHVGADAAGLGKLTVLSSLGQPLRAELDLGATRDELSGMTVRLASADAFRQAGIEFSPALTDLRFIVDKRPGGAPVIRVSSNKAINEPFLDFLVELNWPAGRLVREYTFLLDPPEVKARQTAPVVAEAKVVEGVRDTVRAAEPAPVVRKPEPAAETPRPAPAPASRPAPADAAATRIVQPGDTLRRIAGETKPEEVSLEQMLVALYRRNPDAFLGNNIHRMKSGAILSIPDRDSVAAISQDEARKVYVSHTGDWNAFRQKLASVAPASAARDEGGQTSAGRITARADEKAVPPEAPRDQVRVSRTEVAGKPGSKSSASEADVIAREKALKEAQERLAMLERNVGELQKLLEMKNQHLADLQKQLSQKQESKPVEPVRPVEPVKAPEPAKPAEPVAPPKPVEAPKDTPAPAAPEKPAEPAKAEEAPKAEEAKAEPAAKPAEAPKPVRMPPPPPEPEPEPDFVSMLLEDPTLLAGGGGIAAILLGYALYRRRRQASGASGSTTVGAGSAATAYPVTGGQSIDTANTPPQTGDFSQTGPGTIDTDEVDPVAEADVYMAYGRDAQAEEILLEALLKDPHRIAIHVKLLEIYAQRRSLKQFETLASEVYAQTGGQGAEWAKVAALGAGIDPGNPLYSGAQAAAEPAFSPDATMIVQPEDNPQRAMAEPETMAATQVTHAEEAPALTDSASLDFDLGELSGEAPVASEPPVDERPTLDFDLGEPLPEAPAVPAPAVEESNLLDFDLGELSAPPVASETEAPAAVADELDFDLDLPAELPPEPVQEVSSVADLPVLDAAPVAEPEMPELAIPDISLDLAEPPKEEEALPLAVSDFDLDLDLPEAVAPSESPATIEPETAPDDVVLEFDLGDLPTEAPQAPAAEPAPADLDFDFDLDLPQSPAMPSEAPAAIPEFDLGDLDLDLGTASAAEPDAVAGGESVRDAHWEEVNTKLDLAKAYEEMGDLEGARELLNEVVGEGTPDLVAQAQEILTRIGR